MILLLGGTSESLAVADRLKQMGRSFVMTVVSDAGVRMSQPHARQVIKTTFTPESFDQFCQTHQIEMVIDATHPFARVISQLTMAETAKLKIPYLRFERSNHYASRVHLKMVDSTATACQYLKTIEGRVYISTGSKTAPEYVKELGISRLHVRALPTPHAIGILSKAGFAAWQIDAIQGPFTTALNVDLFKHARAQIVVTKESGRRGGVPEKLAACEQLQLPCVVIRRPHLAYPDEVMSLDALQRKLAKDYAG